MAASKRIDRNLETANDRLKRGFGNRFWQSILFATVVHFLVFAFYPTMQAQGSELTSDPMEALVTPPEVVIPPPPEQVRRPATPIVAEVPVDEDITIARNTFEAMPPGSLAPPKPNATDAEIANAPKLVPFESPPQLLNGPEILRELERRYPRLLRDAGIGGSVVVWFFVDREGTVANKQLKQTSEYETMDAVALEIASMMKFRPATYRDEPVAVWVQIPIDFVIRR